LTLFLASLLNLATREGNPERKAAKLGCGARGRGGRDASRGSGSPSTHSPSRELWSRVCGSLRWPGFNDGLDRMSDGFLNMATSGRRGAQMTLQSPVSFVDIGSSLTCLQVRQ
jgi:hypothetical protein